MRNRDLAVLLFSLLTFGALLISAANKPQAGAAISGEAKSPGNPVGQMPASFDQDVAKVVAEVDRIEANTLGQMEHATLDRQGQVRTLGKLLLFDKHLSVHQNEACSFCHTPETGRNHGAFAFRQPASVRVRSSVPLRRDGRCSR